jgi:hypothetical protein
MVGAHQDMEKYVLTQETFEVSPQLWSRMAFWMDGAVSGFERPERADRLQGPVSPEAIADLLFTDPEAAKKAVEIATGFRDFLARILKDGPRDEPYYARLDGPKTLLYNLFILDENNWDREVYFRAANDGEAVMGMLRHATVRQSIFTDVECSITQVRVRRFEFGEINEDGQVFYGEPGTFFEWNAQSETNFDDYGPMSLDASALLWAARLSVDPVFSRK